MRAARAAALSAAVALASGAASAQGRVFMDDAEAAGWRAVGRLNAAGMQFCTAVLIAPDLVLTADHCLTNARTAAEFRPAALTFVAGYRKGSFAALGRVGRILRPGPGAWTDLAVLELTEPIPPALVAPIPVGPAVGAAATIVSYGRDRAHAPSIVRDCPAEPAGRSLMTLDCGAAPGNSGAPVLRLGRDGPEVMAVLSGSLGTSRAVAVAAAPALAPLLRRRSPAP